ncbi:hypothetical protein Poli38472_000178 [Pythium oligandrum]|uniref:Kinesin-like protein n=1 Tax=Pythium oligandrum TaxID=41045 RepID=A0A8K1FF39_PYTOL|nr:hypothetical protein Poli38472_000178 [Pythium oligandrum]|eukprot:TMW60136.1 hypothetical protein Poli38472_000178 [Pythium oligandrum]
MHPRRRSLGDLAFSIARENQDTVIPTARLPSACEKALARRYSGIANTNRPVTSHARIESSPTMSFMPPIAPAPSASSPDKTSKPKTFLPQLSHSKIFATASQDKDDQVRDPEQPEQVANEDTEAFKQAMWAGQANILVAVRVRPLCSHDRDAHEIVKVIDRKVIVVMDKLLPQLSSPVRKTMDPFPRRASLPIRRLKHVAPQPVRTTSNNNNNVRSRERRYAFDHVFGPQDSQQTVYYHTTKFLIHGVLNGFNATVFAYGCTGAGKTHTMFGTPSEPGIMGLTLEDLFQNIDRVHSDPQSTVAYRVTVSFLEVYNENIRDLLVTPPAISIGATTTAEYLDLREDPVRGPVVAGISEVEACNAQEVMKLLRRGNKHRSQEATAANSVSSRSHAVLQVLVEQRDKNSTSDTFGVDPSRGGTMTSTVKYGKLSLVDLAGSERAAVTQNRGLRLIEGANINRSLLALGNCINALGEKGGVGTFVPYRDSKLTRLLKDSLGGNCRTVMIANVSQSAASVEETLNTLKYANRAKNIKTTVTRNVLSVDHHITEYANVISGLKDEINVLKRQLASQSDPEYQDSPEKTSSPKPSARPWIRLPGMRRVSDNNNEVEEERDEAEQPDEEWKQAKLKEARGYISQCFQQRMQLRKSLLEINYKVASLTEMLCEAKPSEPQRILDIIPDPSDYNQGELVASAFDELRDADALEATFNSMAGSEIPVARIQDVVRRLITRKTMIISQLEWNMKVMEEFRVGIEQSPLIRNAELRELLLMEYRVGDLEVENMEQRVKKKIKNTELRKLRARLGITQTSTASASEFEPPTPDIDPESTCTIIPGLLLAEMAEEITPETTTARSTTRFAFLDELRDRFMDRKNSSVEKRVADGVSPRRQWGVHLNNSSLPYIRLKKKAPPQLDASWIRETPSQRRHQPAPLQSVPKSSAAVAAPYLKVLKERRKMHVNPQVRPSSRQQDLPTPSE